ncbi:hypothetical protein Q3G72_025401 [Acer saccharum]|nr:hypothetical protein Q3G72_025401 [Acer saccharum]
MATKLTKVRGPPGQVQRAKGSVNFLNKVVTKAKETATTMQVDMEQLKHAYDMERLKSMQRASKRNALREEKSQLEKENQALHDMIAALEAKVDAFCGEGIASFLFKSLKLSHLLLT